MTISMGDRECPVCEEESLVETSLTKWKCLNPKCGVVLDDKFLDETDIEDSDDV